ncbi:MAG TPA: pyridoxine 5'-phosphate synthase [Chitinophagales bacterium]|nr:pyridoxine 5'-phosphate synthase [Chitinophagales bacterium]
MTRLSVNINKVALLRNARGSNLPDVVQVAKDCERFGAEGITVHPRSDERHIRYRDVYDLKPVVQTEFNIEGYPDERFLQMVCEVRPHQCTLVPDPPNVLTSNAGWNTIEHAALLTDVITRLHAAGIRVSLFIETDKDLIAGAKKVGSDRIEFYTGPYAETFAQNPAQAIAPYQDCAQFATEIGLGINAGHDLNLFNLAYLKHHIPQLLEVSIGHALIADALYLGLENTIQRYKLQLVGNQ